MKRREVLLSICAVAAATSLGAAPASAVAPAAHGFRATMRAKPGMGDAVVALLFEAPTFQMDECSVFLIGRSMSDRDVIFVTERWVSQKAHARFSQSEVAEGYTARFAVLVENSVLSDEIVVGGKAVLR